MNEENFKYVCELVMREAAIVLGTGKEYLVEARLGSVASRHRFPSINAFLDHVRCGPNTAAFQKEIVDALTTNETLFFRDLHPFESLHKEVIPGLLARNEGRIIIWSAACSSGQEPYSLAMMLNERFPDKIDRFQIIATDISTAILRRARAGIYQQMEINRGLPAPLLIKYFRQVSDGWELNEAIRRRVDFRELNLARPFIGMPRCHLVLIRNVMIYFDIPMRQQILRQIKDLLLPGGYLLLGGAETTLMVDDGFAPVNIGRSTFYSVQRG